MSLKHSRPNATFPIDTIVFDVIFYDASFLGTDYCSVAELPEIKRTILIDLRFQIYTRNEFHHTSKWKRKKHIGNKLPCRTSLI